MASSRVVATGYVDLGCDGRTELRIHGVGGTSPEALLDHPHPVQVAGDPTSGFFRRWDADGRGTESVESPESPESSSGQPESPAEGHHVEGFSCGGLTSGSARRALWLLLVPFLLV